MNRPHKYVSLLNEDQISQLNDLIKNSSSARDRMRVHSVLLSSEGYGIDEIAHIYHADRDSVSSLPDRWEQSGTEGLYDKPRSGKPPALNESEIGVVRELIKEHPHPPKIILAKISEKIGASDRRRLNVHGFMSTDNRFESFCFNCNVDTGAVIRCSDEFLKTVRKKTVVIIDNSSVHRSEEFEENIPEWKKK